MSSAGILYTGSWDGTVKIWQKHESIKTLTGHEHAVEVCILQSNNIVTGSANKNLIIFDQNGKMLKTIPNAHSRKCNTFIIIWKKHLFPCISCVLVSIFYLL